MLEVKNRASDMFPITGIPKKEYWVQMQIQMGVCGLSYCDFLETKFAEYSSLEEYEADTTSTKGMFLYFQNESESTPLYVYPRYGASENETTEFFETKKKRAQRLEVCKNSILETRKIQLCCGSA